tara:strand:+ start:626 stop:814 length:189 start_codon:yes stop_codon:yes gene_type:complete
MNNKLIPFYVEGKQVALISENLPDYIKDIIINNYDKSSSGMGSHYSLNDRDWDHSPLVECNS